MILWILRNLRYRHGATGRHLNFHPVLGMAQGKEILLAISSWASNGHLERADLYRRAPLVVAVILVVLFAAIRASRRKEQTDLRPALPLLYIFSYIIVLLLTSTFLQANLLLDSLRILLPIHVFVIILMVHLGSRLYQGLETRAQKAAASGLCVVISVSFLVWMTQWARSTREDGQGYASSIYTDSEMLQTVRGLPKDGRFYSNLPWPIGIYTDRLWSQLPSRIDNTTLGENTEYPAQMEEFARTMREHDVYLAYFREGDSWLAFPSIEEMQSFVPLRAVAETEEGIIYAAVIQ